MRKTTTLAVKKTKEPFLMTTDAGKLSLEVLSETEVRIAEINRSMHPMTLTVLKERALWRFTEKNLTQDQIDHGKELVAQFLRWKKQNPRIFRMMYLLVNRRRFVQR